ncbi:MAG: 4Fe-4S binding protein [Burkholderiales bacterium]|nr:4Fe-4S binding protein [Burkholderiales bacterium]
MAKDKLVCNCNRTMPLDAAALGRALQLGKAPPVHSELCRGQRSAFEAAVKKGGDLVVACTQEAPLFSELHAQWKGEGAIQFANIRETAGWSAQARGATPKIAALLALADLPEPEPVPLVAYRSGGSLLIIGPGAAALEWADRLSGELPVSVLVTGDAGHHELPVVRDYPVFSGRARALTGYLGAFRAEWEQANPIDLEVCTRCNACIRACPEAAIDFSYQIDLAKCRAHRECVTACGAIGAIDFERRETTRSETFDLVFDLSREPLIRSPQPPQGYFAPGRDPLEQALAAREITRYVGEFEKPRYVEYRESVCAHARSGITGCTKCIDVCSTLAIASDLDANRVTVESHLCMGCGGCAAVCPSGAMGYAYPRVPDMGARVKALLRVYREAGGETPCLLLHNATGGRELVSRLARRGKGLPANWIPLEVHHVASIGIDLMLGAVAFGAASVSILAARSEQAAYREALERQTGYAQAIVAGLGLEGARFGLIVADDVATLEKAVWSAGSPRTLSPATFNLANEKRATLDFVLDHLLRHAPRHTEEVPLPAGAPYGAVVVDKEKCTMCLACVGACPEGALLDARDKPQLRFIERNCVQCGLCEKTCPESAIALLPRLLLSGAATRPVVVNEDAIFACVRCGKPFATQRIIDNVLGKLGSHSMFQDPRALARLRMCQDCRVVDMFEQGGDSIFNVTGGG